MIGRGRKDCPLFTGNTGGGVPLSAVRARVAFKRAARASRLFVCVVTESPGGEVAVMAPITLATPLVPTCVSWLEPCSSALTFTVPAETAAVGDVRRPPQPTEERTGGDANEACEGR